MVGQMPYTTPTFSYAISMHNYNYLEIPILIIRSIVAWEGKQMLA